LDWRCRSSSRAPALQVCKPKRSCLKKEEKDNIKHHNIILSLFSNHQHVGVFLACSMCNIFSVLQCYEYTNNNFASHFFYQFLHHQTFPCP
jgi:hypothetical protein